MNIKNYTSFFHAGSIFAIKNMDHNIIIIMESAEMDDADVEDNSIVLSKNDRIRGKLHIEGVKTLKENTKDYVGVFKMKYEEAEIFHLEIHSNKVQLQIIWNSYPSKLCIEDFSTIEIEAEKIWGGKISLIYKILQFKK